MNINSLNCFYKNFRSTLFILFFLLSFSIVGLSQNKIDSLRNLLDNENDSQKRAQLYNELSLENRNKDLQLAFQYARTAAEIASQNNYTKELGVAQSLFGLLYSYTDLLDSAVYWNLQAIPLLLPSSDSLEIGRNYSRLGTNYQLQNKTDKAAEYMLLSIKWSNSPKVKAVAYNNLGMISKQNGDYAKAVSYYLNALKQQEILNDPIAKARVLNNLGSLYIQKKDYVKAQNCFKESYSYIENVPQPEILGQSLAGLGLVTMHLGTKNDAIMLFSRAADIFQKAGMVSDYAKQLVNLADVQSEMKRYKLAEKNYFLAEKILLDQKDEFGLSAIYNNISDIYLKLNKPILAVKYLEKAYKLSQTYQDMNFNRLIVKNLSNTYETLGDAEKALKYRKIYESLNDQMVNVAENVKYVELNHAYETGKKETKIKQQDQQITEMKSNWNKIIYLLAALVVLVLGVLILYRRRIKEKLKLEENISSISKQISSLKTENSELRNQLIETEKELQSLVLKYSQAKEKLPENLVSLSKREYEVLLFIAEGLSDKEIAEKIFVSINTVRTHVRRIYDKLFINSRVEAVRYLNQYQLLAEAS